MSNDLTPGQRALLADDLMARRSALLGALEQHHEGQSRVEHASDVRTQDDDDGSQRASDRAVDLAFTDMEVQALQAIERAIAMVHDPRFGVCRDCGGAIAFDRLRAEPQATRCVACAGATERTHPPGWQG